MTLQAPVLLEVGDGPLQTDQRCQEGIQVCPRSRSYSPLHLHMNETQSVDEDVGSPTHCVQIYMQTTVTHDGQDDVFGLSCDKFSATDTMAW